MNSGLTLSHPTLKQSGALFASIDDNELLNLRSIVSSSGTRSLHFETQIIIQSNKRGQTYQKIAKTHEYLLVYSKSENTIFNELPKEFLQNSLKDDKGNYELWELRNRNPKFGRHNRPNLFYPVYVSSQIVCSEGYAKVSLLEDEKHSIKIEPKNSEGQDSCWRWGVEKTQKAIEQGGILVGKQKRDGGWNIYEKARKGTTKAKSIWSDTDVISEQGTIQLGSLGVEYFGFPKRDWQKFCVSGLIFNH